MEFPKLRGCIEAVKYPCYAEYKIDGEATFFVKDGDECYLINKYGRKRCNKITEMLRGHLRAYSQVILFGELFVGDGKNGALYKLLSNKENDDALRFAIVEMIMLDAEPIKTARDSKFLLDSTFNFSDEELRWVFVLNQLWLNDRAEVQKFFEYATNDQGYEGIVVKEPDTPLYVNGPNAWVKMKYKDRSDFKLVLIDSVKDRIEVELESGRRCGCKATSKQKQGLTLGCLVTIEHQGVLETGGLRHPVFIGAAKAAAVGGVS